MAGFYLLRRILRNKGVSAKALEYYVIAGSLIFYALFGVRNILVLLCSILFNSLVIFLLNNSKGSASSRIILGAGVAVNVLCLLFFKFSGIFFPVAISFYTFNQISFIVDHYRSLDKEDENNNKDFDLSGYLLYVLFFPKLLQGPLMRAEAFREEFKKAASDKFDFEVLMRALFLFSMGLFKKVILADTFGAAVDFGFDNLASMGSVQALLTAVFYSFQLYFDFSGYCDMAGAISMMMGIDLVLNFDSPYKAVNIIDFWKRWHITLTRFFTTYVYITLGGNRKGAARTYINLLLIFLLSGLWHGNGWTFIVWGAMHGILYAITRALGGDKKESGIVVTFIKRVLTFAYVTAAWVFFRAPKVSDGLLLFARIFTGGKKALPAGFSSCFQLDEIWYVLKVTPLMKLSFAWDICLWLFLLVAVIIIFFADNAISISRKCKIGIATTFATFVLLLWSIVSFAGVSTFLYMNF
jgi:D-alanyl-lipoteichoic acid acyltransferase DltB (MBOAT superfamily)